MAALTKYAKRLVEISHQNAGRNYLQDYTNKKFRNKRPKMVNSNSTLHELLLNKLKMFPNATTLNLRIPTLIKDSI
jgi:hypothetical protein